MRAWLLIALVGCGDGNGTPADASEIDSGPVCTHLQNLRLVRGKAETFGTVDGARFGGEVCIENRADIACAQVATDRSFELCGPADADFGIRFTKEGFEHTVYLQGPSTLPTAPFVIADDAFAGPSYWMAIGGAYPPTDKGHLVVVAYKDNGDGTTSPLTGATIAITPSTGLAVVYLGDNGLPDGGAPSTRASGVGLVADVPPGMYDIKVTHASFPNCAFLSDGFTSPDAGQQIRVPAIAATTVIAQLRCKP